MATSAQVREWAAGNGHPELAGGRGKLGDQVWAEYEAAHPPGAGADDYAPGTAPDDFSGDGDPAGDSGYVAADEPPSGSPDAGQGPGEPAGVEEERPSRPRTGRPHFRFGKRKRAAGPGQEPKGRKPRPRIRNRVSVAPLIEELYGDLAWTAAGIPPLQRYFYSAAPVAGVVLDPVVKNTVADRLVFQPASRHYEQAKVAMALLGTPASLMGVLATAPQPVGQEELLDQAGKPVLDERGNPVVVIKYAAPSFEHKSAMVSLRYCVRAMADVAGGEALARVQERAEENAARDGLVNQYIAYLLGMPYAPDAAEQAEEERGRQAGLKLAGAAT